MQTTNTQKQLLLLNANPERLAALYELLNKNTAFNIIKTSCVRATIDILKTEKIDFIVSNINLQNFDGWRLARMVRSGVLMCSADTPFVVVANTWCEHLANTTAREFGINRLIAFSDREKLLNIINQEQLVPLEDMEKGNLLVIEDNPDTLNLVNRILSNRFNIDSAEDGETGLELWKEKTYSLVLLDVMLPGMSGNQVLEEIIKARSEQSVVIMTANHTMELAEELMLKGASDFVTKPFRAEQLRRVCETAARREDFIISNKQFAKKIDSLNASRKEYKLVSERHQKLLNQLGSIIIELNERGEITFLNKAWEKHTGFKIENSVNKPFIEFFEIIEHHGKTYQKELDILLSGSITAHKFEFTLKNNLDETLWVEARFDITTNANNSHNISGTIDNISSRKQAQADLEYLAMHDGLTSLYNRHYFESELNRLTLLAKEQKTAHALLYLDLDHFKVINDTVGHHQGDIVLKNIASLMKSKIRTSDFLARIGGDEFALLLPSTCINSALSLANDICTLFNEYKCIIDGQHFKLSCSIGIAEILGHSNNSDEYLKQADIALYAAKKQGRNLVHVYDKDDIHSKDLQENLAWIKTLHQAVEDDNFILHFQPIVNISTRKVDYYEALVRLELEGKVIMPGEFIPALERAGEMSLLDRQVIKKAISYLAKHPELTKLAINLSAQGFSDERLVPLIQEMLAKYHVDATRIIFELTESASLNNIEATKEMINKLALLGCGFSIDDFGTGFSTFSYLKQLPAESVKIDGSFIVDLNNNSVDLSLVKAIYEVATALNKKTVAEFVENEETLTILAEIGVTYAQGYFLGRPMPVEKLFND